MASLISPRSLAPSLSLFFFLFSFAEDGRSLYMKHCAQCHHENRIGRTAPPLIPQFLKRKGDSYIKKVIREGIPASTMPAFSNLSEENIDKIVSYIRKPAGKIKYSLEDIEESHTRVSRKPKKLHINNLKDLVVVVDKGANEIWVVEGTRVLDRFSFRNVHGGVKFSIKGDKFYVPARDGWIASYDIKLGKPDYKVRACVYLRNIALSPEGNRLVASCVLPPSLVLMDGSLKPLKRIGLPGKPGAVYELSRTGGFVLTFRDIPRVAFLNRDGSLILREVDTPLEDFFIDPFEEFIVGSSRSRRKLLVYAIDTMEKVYERDISGLPHLFSSSFWYSGGNFFFATRHMGSTKVSLWKLYDWKLVKEIDTGGRGFFVRSSPSVPELWVDNSDNTFVLIDKRTLRVKRINVTRNGKATHVEFTPGGKFAYVSVVGERGKLLIYDPLKKSLLKTLPAVHPAGKYNYVLKTRKFYPSLLGEEVFMAKCWGCHHPTQRAFGPSFRWIARNRSRAEIVSQILNPQETARILGYKRNAMPKIELSERELKAVLAFIESFKGGIRYAGH
ncbi:cytochrome D1 domain-containing protein [Hydrogenivirga sp.]